MKLRSALLSIVVIGGGIAAAQSLVASAPQPERKEIEARRTPVQVVEVARTSTRVTVTGMGTVVPARKVDLYAEVGGRVLAQYDGLREGERVPKGTRLVRVDARDYKYAVDTAKASLAQARARLEEERNRKEVAERDWELLSKSLGSIDAAQASVPGSGDTTPEATKGDEEPAFNPGDMARRVPQIQSAQANLRSVRSQLEQAKLQVGRTKIIAPFDAVVLREDVEVGQLVGPTTSLATLVGTDEFHVKVSVPVDSLSSIAIPGTNTSADIGAPARVVQDVGGQEVVREGYVVRLLGELERDGRMAQLVVAVKDPFELDKGPEQRGLPLLLGSYVRVEIEGALIEDVIELPRTALRQGDRVWLVSPEDELQIRPVDVAWRTRDAVFVTQGLRPSDRVIASRLAVPIENMPLRVVEAADGDEAPRAGDGDGDGDERATPPAAEGDGEES